MKAIETLIEGMHILTEADFAANITPAWFQPDTLRAQGQLQGEAKGRGSAWLVRLENQDCVLRHYYRGGAVGRIAQDSFIWHGLSRSRSWREWYLLAEIQRLQLPAPTPVAAAVCRRGWRYRCDLITRKIADTTTLADRLLEQHLPAKIWIDIGSTIARFHQEGIWHADLNARNILLSTTDQVYLIDFDKGRILYPQPNWQQGNLKRLRRSLNKYSEQFATFNFSHSDWEHLLQGYRDK